jgi:hypothetical protein
MVASISPSPLTPAALKLVADERKAFSDAMIAAQKAIDALGAAGFSVEPSWPYGRGVESKATHASLGVTVRAM